MANILIIDDEKAINDLIALNLKMVGHTSIQLFDGSQVIETIQRTSPDLILLDVMLPGRDGFSLMKELRSFQIPVIFLTAKAAVADRVMGLDIGAEDYIVKPFETIELLARINVILRRNQKGIREFQLNDTRINFTEHKVWVSEREIELTNREFALLEFLIQNKNIALSRDTIINKIWGYDFFGETRTVDVHIQKLRKKLNWEKQIKTIYKYGYRLEA